MVKIGLVDIDVSHPQAFAGKMEELGIPMGYTHICNLGFRENDEVEAFAAACGAKVMTDIAEMAKEVDVGFVQGCNWDQHLEKAMPFIEAGKPVFIDKPLVGSLADVKRVRELVKGGARILGSSSMRYAQEILDFLAMPVEERGEIIHVYSAIGVGEFNYAIHAVEIICALAFLISACKGFYKLNEDTASGLWNENVPTTVTDFYDITIGVISGGMVGRHLVKLLKSFHVDILMYDPILSAEEIAAIGAEKVELDELLKRSDAVTVHAPAIPATENMLNKDNLCLLRDGAVLVNTARGSIINERDLIEELKKGRIFACLDVTEPEPPTADNELRTLKNVVLTPHIAGTNTNGLKRIALHVCEEVERLLRGEKMKAEVNLDNLSKLA